VKNGLFFDLRANMDVASAAHSTLRVRDLVATAQVTPHVVSDLVRSWDDVSLETQGGGDQPCCAEGCPVEWTDDVNPFTLCDECLPSWRRWNAERAGGERDEAFLSAGVNTWSDMCQTCWRLPAFCTCPRTAEGRHEALLWGERS